MRSNYLRRREFIALLSGAAATWPLAAHAQQDQRVRSIGVLMSYLESDPEAQAWYAAFREGLQKLGGRKAATSRSTLAGRHLTKRDRCNNSPRNSSR